MNHTSKALAIGITLVAGAMLSAQGAAPGLRLYNALGSTDTFLVDTNNTVVHTWAGTGGPGMVAYMDADGSVLRAQNAPGGPAVPGRGGQLLRIGFDGTILWDYAIAGPNQWAHIDIAPMPNGNVLLLVWDLMAAQDAIDAGRDPSLLAGSQWLPDAVIEVQQTGQTTGDVVWEWHFMDHVIQDFDSSKANFGVVADHPELLDINFPRNILTDGEWNHCNALDYDPVRDLVVVNSLFQEEFYLIDHSTTTAEAAGSTGGTYGRGGDILYRWGNPQAYGAGTADDQKLFGMHGTSFIREGLVGAGNMLIFNNQAGRPFGMNYSSVVELRLPASFSVQPGSAFGPSGFAWEYTDPFRPAFYSPAMANAQRLPNGNTLVCSAQQAWLFEINASGQKVWEYFPVVPTPPAFVFRAEYHDRFLWADTESASSSSSVTVDFDLVAGRRNAQNSYALLGSASGTAPGIAGRGFVLPLNPDAYLNFTALAGLPGFSGTLDGLGNASASLTLPPLPPLMGMTLNHAFAVVDRRTMQVNLTSNPVPLVFTP
ncbi:MAG: aryl-sulfate sulfotransferase [Planctomycetota bacterium]